MTLLLIQETKHRTFASPDTQAWGGVVTRLVQWCSSSTWDLAFREEHDIIEELPCFRGGHQQANQGSVVLQVCEVA